MAFSYSGCRWCCRLARCCPPPPRRQCGSFSVDQAGDASLACLSAGPPSLGSQLSAPHGTFASLDCDEADTSCTFLDLFVLWVVGAWGRGQIKGGRSRTYANVASSLHSRQGTRCLSGGRRVPGHRDTQHLTRPYGLGSHLHVCATWSWKEVAFSGAGAFFPLGSRARLQLLILTGLTGSRHRACRRVSEREGAQAGEHSGRRLSKCGETSGLRRGLLCPPPAHVTGERPGLGRRHACSASKVFAVIPL